MTGEIARALTEPYESTTDDDDLLDRLVGVAAEARAREAAQRAREAEAEAVICVEVAGMSVRQGAQVLGVSPQKATRMRRSYSLAAMMVPPEIPDQTLGRRLQEHGWPETEGTIREALEGMAWHSMGKR